MSNCFGHLLVAVVCLAWGADDPAVIALIERLQATNPAVLVKTIKALEDKGQAARPAVPALLALLKEPDPSKTVHPAVYRAAERIGLDEALVPSLLADLKSPEKETAERGARLLGIVGEPAVGPLLKTLNDPVPAIRLRGAVGLFHLRNIPQKALTPLVERLQDGDEGVQAAAAAVLGKMGRQAAPAVPGLIKALEAKSLMAAHALGRIGPAAKDAVPALRAALADAKTSRTVKEFKSSDVGKVETREISLAETAADALGGIGADAADAVPDLKKALRDGRPAVRLQSARALGKIGADAADAVSDLAALLGDVKQPKPVPEEAAAALSKIGEAAGPALLTALDDRNKNVRLLAIMALSRVRPLPDKVVGSLAQRLEDDESEVRGWAARALGEIGAAAEKATPDLVLALTARVQHDQVRKEAAEALAKVGGIGGTALVKATKSVTPLVRLLATGALGKARPLPRNGLAALVTSLADPVAEIRAAAATALGDTGAEAKDAIPALEQRAQLDPVAEVRKAAAAALEKAKEWRRDE